MIELGGAAVLEIELLLQVLRDQGWLLLRETALTTETFGQLIGAICPRMAFDPARESITESVQSVDAGTDAVGLHIENGNTPLPPDIVAFFSQKSAPTGAQTTVCDGSAVLRSLPAAISERLTHPYTMTRYLPKVIWQRYIAQAWGREDELAITTADLDTFISSIPGQSYQPRSDGSIDYTLTLPALRSDNLSRQPAFANALLGPSFNYEPPVYRDASGKQLDDKLLSDLAAHCEAEVREIAWRDGDVAIIDNKRCLHGRRAITVPLSERRLVIAMGSLTTSAEAD